MRSRKIRTVTLLAAGALVLSGLTTAVRAEDTVEKCNKLLTDLRKRVADSKLSGASLEKAEAFLTKMDNSCKNRLFTEAGAAGLDILIEIDAAGKK